LIAARKLIDAGAAAVMHWLRRLFGLGIQNPAALRILRERITEVPMIVDAGVGTASDAAVAMELGADGILMNTPSRKPQIPFDGGSDARRYHRRPESISLPGACRENFLLLLPLPSPA